MQPNSSDAWGASSYLTLQPGRAHASPGISLQRLGLRLDPKLSLITPARSMSNLSPCPLSGQPSSRQAVPASDPPASAGCLMVDLARFMTLSDIAGWLRLELAPDTG